VTDDLRTRLLALLGRKFLIAAFIVLAATALRALNLLDQAGMLTAWGSAMGLFGLANVSQKAVTKTNNSTSKEAS
jgi:hypothetical protein